MHGQHGGFAVLRRTVVNAGEIGSGYGGRFVVDPRGATIYVAGFGDTYSSLADALLGDANRWGEIYGLQSEHWRTGTKRGSRDLVVGDQLYMPQEAIDAAGVNGHAADVQQTAFFEPGPQPEPVVPAGVGPSPSPPSPSPTPSPVHVTPTPAQPSHPVNWRKVWTWGGAIVGGLAAVALVAGAVHSAK